MERGLSRVTDNEVLVHQARSQVEQDFNITSRTCATPPVESPDSPPGGHQNYRQLVDGIETPVYTFTLPDITRYPGKRICKTYVALAIFIQNQVIYIAHVCILVPIFHTSAF